MKRLSIALFAGACASTVLLQVSAADATEAPRHVWSETVLYKFCSQPNCSDGGMPVGGLVEDRQDNLYGTTVQGGDSKACSGIGCGTVFRVAPDGTETVLHAFVGGSTDGSEPAAAPILDKVGNLYGTTQYGGPSGRGTVYRIAPDGTTTLLHSFGGGNDGVLPVGSLVEDAAGNLYGTTGQGGDYDEGVVFKVATDGTESVLHSFGSGSDGAYPWSGLIEDESGILYGTTEQGGGGAGGGDGTVFKIKRDGAGETVIYAFNGDDGAFPRAPLIQDSSGNFYGTTLGGGNSACGVQGCGTVFKLKPDGILNVLYEFNGGDGDAPMAGLLLDNAGGLNGTASGGTNNAGMAFRIRRDGGKIDLYDFCSKSKCSDGDTPVSGELLKPRSSIRVGVRYGTTVRGGKISAPYCSLGCGVVFKLSR